MTTGPVLPLPSASSLLPNVHLVPLPNGLPGGTEGPKYTTEVFHFDWPQFRGGKRMRRRKRETMNTNRTSSTDSTFFTAYYSAPSEDGPEPPCLLMPDFPEGRSMHKVRPRPIMVYLKDGPASQAARWHDTTNDLAMAMGIRLIVVNHRGSTGMGDRVQNALTGFVSQVGENFV